MSLYYYLVASLPLLSREMERPPSTEEFLDTCRRLMSEDDYRELEKAGIGNLDTAQTRSTVLAAWLDRERSLRNELVKLRAARLEIESDRYLREAGFSRDVFESARDAVNQDSPLEAEEILDRSRWNFLENLAVGHHFDLDRLIVYYLELQLLERSASFDRERGLERFEEIYRAAVGRPGQGDQETGGTMPAQPQTSEEFVETDSANME